MAAFDIGSFLTSLLISAGSFTLSQLLRERNRTRLPLQDFDLNSLPTAQQGEAVPVVFGTVRLQPLNTLGRGIARGEDVKGDKQKRHVFGGHFEPVVGRNYTLSVALGLCMGEIDYIQRVWIDGSILVPARKTFTSFFVPPFFSFSRRRSGVERIDVDYREGDNSQIGGKIVVYTGSADQAFNPELRAIYGSPRGSLAYKHFCYLWFTGQSSTPTNLATDDFSWGALNRLPGLSVEVCRIPNGLGLNPFVIPGLVDANGRPDINNSQYWEDANPANVLYDVLTNPLNRKIDPSDIDIESFREAGRILAEERHGYSNAFTSYLQTQQIIEDVLTQIDGLMFQDATGKTRLRLLREPETAPVTNFRIDESHCQSLPTISIQNTEQTISQVKVNFPDPRLEHNVNVASVQDDAALQDDEDGSLRTQEIDMQGISNPRIANVVATRRLRALTTPLMFVEVSVLADTFGEEIPEPGDLIDFSYAPDGISNVPLRLLDLTINNPADNPTISIKAAQDLFSVNQPLFDIEDSDEAPEQILPLPRALQGVSSVELPRLLSRQLDNANPDTSSFFYQVEGQANDTGFYDFEASINGEEDVVGEPSHRASLQSALTDSASSLTLSDFAGALKDLPVNISEGSIRAGDWLLLIDDEIIGWRTTASRGNGVFELQGLERGLYDTIPVAHSANAKAWILGLENRANFGSLRFGGYPRALTLNGIITPRNAIGSSGPATEYEHIYRGRALRPLMPVIEGLTSNRNRNGTSLTFQIKNRNHLDETLRLRSDAGVEPYPGATLNFSWFDYPPGGGSYHPLAGRRSVALSGAEQTITVNFESNREFASLIVSTFALLPHDPHNQSGSIQSIRIAPFQV